MENSVVLFLICKKHAWSRKGTWLFSTEYWEDQIVCTEVHTSNDNTPDYRVLLSVILSQINIDISVNWVYIWCHLKDI